MTLAYKRPIKLLLLIPHLGGGGAERVTSLLAQYLDSRRFQIHVGLITNDAPGALPLPAWVVVHRLDTVRVRYVPLKLLRLVHNVSPNLVLGGMAHLNFLLLLLYPFFPRKTRILIRQNTTASAASNWMTGLLYRRLYPRATGIVCQSEAMASDLITKFGIPPRKIVVLSNPVPRPLDLKRDSDFGVSGTPSLLSVARLSPEKGVDLLLHAMVIVKRDFPAVRLTILGIGPEESSLKGLAKELELQSQVIFAGFLDPAPFFAESALFVCPSRYEGMPNALLEAGAAGLPLVATPSSRGVTGLLRGAPGTWLTAEISANALAATLIEAMHFLQELPLDERRFQHAFLAPFDTAKAIYAYETFLLRVEATGHL